MVYGKHNVRRFRFAFVKEPHQYKNDKLHSGVIIVVENHFVATRFVYVFTGEGRYVAFLLWVLSMGVLSHRCVSYCVSGERPIQGLRLREVQGKAAAMGELCLQERFSPTSWCFGCGPANPQGLHLKSYGAEEDKALVATFLPALHHQAFPAVVNGGILGALLDCHSNWAAAYALMKHRAAATPPCTVTAEFHVRLRRPTPMDQLLHLRAMAVEIHGDRAVVEATLGTSAQQTATCTGIFVAVKEGHPAFHRW
jgi:acyl-coenzyme A thioesterase PaaI-like protein